MPWNQSLYPLLIVTAGPGFSGEFVYAPAPGPGNLITSVAAGDGTDPYGNAFVHGLITYATISGVRVAQGWQDGSFYFATAPGPGGPYTVASQFFTESGGSLINGFFAASDVNGTTDPPVLTQIDHTTILMSGRLGTPSSGPVLLTTFAQLGPPFLLPPAGGPVPEFVTANYGGGEVGNVMLRPDGNMQLGGNFGNNATVLVSGSFQWQP